MSTPRTAPAARPPDPRRRWPLGLSLALLLATLGVAVVAVHGDLPSGRLADASFDPPSLTPSLTPSRAAEGLGAGDGDLGGASVAVDATGPAVDRLDPDLLAALRSAAADAADDGIEVRITSGWRSRAYQQRLLDRALERYGSLEEALRWVADPDESRHVTGDAVDVGPTDAAYWMAQHGAAHGLCQTYANEVWHYELGDAGGGCPPVRQDGSS